MTVPNGIPESGFVLAEAVAAIAISAIAAAGLIAALSSAGSRAAEADLRRLALQQATYLIAEAAASKDDSALASSGRTASERLTWSRTLTPLDARTTPIERIEVIVARARQPTEILARLETYRIPNGTILPSR